MLNHIRPAIVFVVLMTILTGIMYPLAMTGLSQALFPNQANGSLIKKGDIIVGSHLIGQTFVTDNYFHGRPSATTATDPNDSTKTVPAPYNAANSNGSNLGPTSQALVDGVKTMATTLQSESNQRIPVDMVTTSGSGLDPDITPAAARFQIPRIAHTRHLPENIVSDLINQHITPRTLGVFGEPTVNVLELNMALDKTSP